MPTPPPLELDVRPLLAAERSPLPAIMEAVERLAPGQALRLRVPFEPHPLYARMAARGYRAEPVAKADHWEILFVPNDTNS